VHVLVPDSMAGAVHRKAGSKIKETGQRAGCKLRMTARLEGSSEPRVLVIVGSNQATSAAQMILHEQLREAYIQEGYPEPTAYAVTMQVRKECCGAIIGKQGSGIRDLRERTGTKILLKQESEVEHCRPCHIEGLLPNVLEAQRAIYEAQLLIPLDEGRRSSEKRPRSSEIVGMGQACGGGPTVGTALSPTVPGASDPAKRRRADGSFELEAQDHEECRFLVPEVTIGLVIGKQGGNLKGVRERLGVRVEVKKQEEAPHWIGDRLVVFKGPTANRALAVEHMLKAAQAHNSQGGGLPDATNCCKVLIPASKVGHVVGEGGSILRWLQENFSVQPEIGNNEVNGEYLLTVLGQSACILEAAKQIVGLLDVDAQQAQNDPARMASQHQYAAALGCGGAGMVDAQAMQTAQAAAMVQSQLSGYTAMASAAAGVQTFGQDITGGAGYLLQGQQDLSSAVVGQFYGQQQPQPGNFGVPSPAY